MVSQWEVVISKTPWALSNRCNNNSSSKCSNNNTKWCIRPSSISSKLSITRRVLAACHMVSPSSSGRYRKVDSSQITAWFKTTTSQSAVTWVLTQWANLRTASSWTITCRTLGLQLACRIQMTAPTSSWAWCSRPTTRLTRCSRIIRSPVMTHR